MIRSHSVESQVSRIDERYLYHLKKKRRKKNKRYLFLNISAYNNKLNKVPEMRLSGKYYYYRLFI